jgi:FlaA1/EpsC-like NDP-sugar epimerase
MIRNDEKPGLVRGENGARSPLPCRTPPYTSKRMGLPADLRRFAKNYSPRFWSIKHIAIDSVLIVGSLFFSLLLRTGRLGIEDHLSALERWAGFFLALRILTYIGFGVYQCMWRYVSVSDAVRLAQATAFSAMLMITATFLYPHFGALPRSFFFIDAFVCLSALMGARGFRRRLYERGGTTINTDAPSRVLIYGAGSSGRMFVQRMRTTPDRGVQVVGYIDDDIKKLDKLIDGVRVLGQSADLDGLLRSVSATDLVVAIKEPSADLLRNLVLVSRKYKVKPQILANFSGKGFDPKNISLYRELDLKDLLKRPAASTDVEAVREMIQGKCVLVTGAGGSIGAELSRQIDRFGPAKLILLDHSEFALYDIDRELRPTAETERVTPVLMDIKDRPLLRKVFDTYRPDLVFHAAAYKHVHLVEANPASAIHNNIGGTKILTELSLEFGVKRFLLVSTDKAVNPVGIMGATKRACELLTSEAGFRSGLPYSSVRFGNVLGSSGSLVPLLKNQIENGGPVTLTHEDMTRYFMLIPEAVSLVLLSSLLSQPGDISVLRMGEPVRIVDLAKSLMALMGRSEEEIPIVFTGVRPGEKMFEELYLTGDEIKTRHPDILTVPKGDSAAKLSAAEFQSNIEDLLAIAEQTPNAAAQELRNLLTMKWSKPSVEVRA